MLCFRNGYSLFTSEKMPEFHHIESKLRMSEVAKLWKLKSQAEKHKYYAQAEKVSG